jgi:hypothetical protein
MLNDLLISAIFFCSQYLKFNAGLLICISMLLPESIFAFSVSLVASFRDRSVSNYNLMFFVYCILHIQHRHS